MKEETFKQKTGVFILFSNVSILGIIIIIYLFHGFDDDQIKELLLLLIPIKTVFITAIVKYIIANKNLTIDSVNESRIITKMYITTTYLLVYGYIGFIALAIIGRGVFSIYGFETMKLLISIIETFFGIYIGLIITDMFKIDNHTNE